MRILVDSCAYTGRNVGDLAMLTVAVSRLRELFPGASLHIITSAPDIVAAHCGNVEAVPVAGRRLVLQDRVLGRFDKLLPAPVVSRWSHVEHRLRLRYTTLVRLSLGLKRVIQGRDLRDALSFLSAIDRADLLVVSGGGVMTDAFLENALGILATLRMAAQRGIPTAMFGQGFGPIVAEELETLAREVLPNVSLIAVRERLASLPLLMSLGVSLDGVEVTGDDAIEMAMPPQGTDLGDGGTTRPTIGVNLRVAPYANVGPEHLAIVREALRNASQVHGAELVPVPIAHRDQMDVNTLRDLLAGLACAEADGGTTLDTPTKVIQQIRRCRVVVTGSYHGAVFALAQGIPTVGLASSTYYRNKMCGLADQFGKGCTVIGLEPTHRLGSSITAAIDAAWGESDRLRPELLARSADQVTRGRAAYARLLSIPAKA